ncbi:hypothetical protein MMIC_P1587 [Mariprofundus micogutta]|uniref:Lipoprotein n=1 Tax=Mariprofundus micogutta TaxID=1921010 RepID=A0A1L8CNW5_9PROT|nr:hypothetical protein [Mariprofundus micogutta]GAV20615.1 hypothetical protein MMIC_P1587 [Mariprofundus micogutta]
MNKMLAVAMVLVATWIGGCSSMHDGKGWEHKGDPITHENNQSDVFEHRH